MHCGKTICGDVIINFATLPPPQKKEKCCVRVLRACWGVGGGESWRQRFGWYGRSHPPPHSNNENAFFFAACDGRCTSDYPHHP
jgi:hypothetical protein